MGKPWVPYVVQQGDHLCKIAYRHSVSADEVWGHEQNSALAALRKNMNILHPGDVVYVPSEPPPGLELQAGTKNTFKAKVPTIEVAVIFRHAGGTPMADEPYEIEGLGADPLDAIEGQTDAEGRVKVNVPVTHRELRIVFTKANEAHTFLIGDMDPITEASGVRKRLENLGILAAGDEHDDNDDDDLHDAIAYFQHSVGLKSTGVMDDETRDALEQAHHQ